MGFLWTVTILLVLALGSVGILFFTGAISIAETSAPAAAPIPTPRPATTQSGGGNAAQGGAAAQNAAAQPKPPVITKSANFGDWIYACEKQEGAPAPVCSIAQQLSDSTTKTPLLLWRITSIAEGKLVGEWQTRTGIMVDRGLVLDAGTDKPVSIPFQLCTPTGCQAVAGLGPDFIASLAKAAKASVTVFPIGQQGLQLTLSVKGLADALTALKQPPG
jgi:invasion protein IalB